MKRIYSLIFLLGFTFTIVRAQKQADFWYFGLNAGLDFNSGVPVSVTGALSTTEGCSSIANANGQLLFYTDGVTVYNKRDSAMSNSGDLMGDVSSTQSALIVPLPGDTNIYYIFTTAADGGANGFRYSIVDMTLDSGRGNVTTKNIPVKTHWTEKVSAVSMRNGGGYWVMTHEWGGDGFYAYRLTTAGFDTGAVVSHVGSVHSDSIIQDAYGYLKFSPSAQKLACAIDYQAIFELFDFNDSSGVVSNPITLNAPDRTYGVEFSADNSKLYTTRYNVLFDEYFLDQYDLSSGNAGIIIASQTTIANPDAARALQLGPDKKIYLARGFYPYLSAIDFPDSVGLACAFVDDAIDLGNNSSALGLPGFVQSYFRSAPRAAFAASDTTVCQHSCISFSDLSLNQASSWQWHFNGANPDTSTAQNPQNICYNAGGLYDVELIVGNDAGFDTLLLVHAINVLQQPPVSVNVNGDTLQAFNAVSYQWYLNNNALIGDTADIYITNGPGNYGVLVTDSNGCSTMSSPIVLTGIKNVSSNNTLKVYPVPASNYVTLQMAADWNTAPVITVQNVLGEVITTGNMVIAKNEVRINIQTLPNGLYIVKCKMDSEVKSAVFIKE